MKIRTGHPDWGRLTVLDPPVALTLLGIGVKLAGDGYSVRHVKHGVVPADRGLGGGPVLQAAGELLQGEG